MSSSPFFKTVISGRDFLGTANILIFSRMSFNSFNCDILRLYRVFRGQNVQFNRELFLEGFREPWIFTDVKHSFFFVIRPFSKTNPRTETMTSFQYYFSPNKTSALKIAPSRAWHYLVRSKTPWNPPLTLGFCYMAIDKLSAKNLRGRWPFFLVLVHSHCHNPDKIMIFPKMWEGHRCTGPTMSTFGKKTNKL